MPRSRTPTAPRESHPSDSSVLASGTLKPWPTASIAFTRLNCFGEARLPCGLQCSLCTLHLFCSPAPADSATGATLGTGCWLGFARLGLPAREDGAGHPMRSAKLRLAHQRSGSPGVDVAERSESARVFPLRFCSTFESVFKPDAPEGSIGAQQ